MNDGSNLPPAGVDPLRDRLYEDHKPLLTRRDELDAAIARFPEEIEDEETAGKAADFVNQINEFLKTSNKVFEDEKAPFLAAGRTCDNFKHALIDEIEKGKAIVNKVRKRWADKKAAEELARRQEAERIAREEAAEAQRKADEARRKAEEEAAAAQARADEIKRLAEAEAAEAKRIADEAVAAAETEAELERAEAADKEAARIKKIKDKEIEDAQKIADREGKVAAKEAEEVQKDATRADKFATRATKATEAKPAELGKSRGEYGGQTTLRTFWDFHGLDRDTLDLEALRQHIPIDDLEKGVRSWIKANTDGLRKGLTLRGVEIFDDTKV